MKLRGTRIGMVLATAVVLAGCTSGGATTPSAVESSESVAPSPTTSASARPDAALVAAGVCIGDVDERTLPYKDRLDQVVVRGRPATALLCWESGAGDFPRSLNADRTYRALRAATPKPQTGTLCATDVSYGLLTLTYTTGPRAQLLVDGICPSVLQRDAKAPNGQRATYFPRRFESMFDPYS